MGDSHADISKHVRSYIGVFVALAVLTIITVAASRIHVSVAMHNTIALTIALVKATLVAAIFMHLLWEKSAWIWWALAITGMFFVTLMLLPVLTVEDLPPQVVRQTWDILPENAPKSP